MSALRPIAVAAATAMYRWAVYRWAVYRWAIYRWAIYRWGMCRGQPRREDRSTSLCRTDGGYVVPLKDGCAGRRASGWVR